MGKSFGGEGIANNPQNTAKNVAGKGTLPRDDVDPGADPYAPKGHFEDGTVCCSCGAVYRHQHWNLDARRRDLLLNAATPNQVLCPGCTIIQQRNPEGVVTLNGDYWPRHREEILNLIRNEEAEAAHVNPLERIIDIREEGPKLVVETTREKLAQRIGRSIHSAHKGEVEYKWSEDNHLVRVNWERKAA